MPKYFGWQLAGLIVLALATITVSAVKWQEQQREKDAAFAACSGYRIEGHDGWGQVRLCVTEVPHGHP